MTVNEVTVGVIVCVVVAGSTIAHDRPVVGLNPAVEVHPAGKDVVVLIFGVTCIVGVLVCTAVGSAVISPPLHDIALIFARVSGPT